jgi:hypothetical protein
MAKESRSPPCPTPCLSPPAQPWRPTRPRLRKKIPPTCRRYSTASGRRCCHCVYPGGNHPDFLPVTFLVKLLISLWCRFPESNRGPTDYKSVALPTELNRRL